MLVLLGAGTVWLLYGSQWLRVERVSVSGTRVLTPAQVREAAGVPAGSPLISVDTDAIASALPKETVLRLMSNLAAAVQSTFKIRWPHRAVPRAAEARFRNLDAARAFEEGTNAYEQMEYSVALAAFRLS